MKKPHRTRSHRAALKKAGVLLAALLAEPSCATLTADECRVVDWSELGRADGVAGRSAERIAAHQNACAKAGVAADVAAYEAGRRAGLETFCTPEGIYGAASRGRAYEGVCPEVSPAMRVALERGEAYHRVKSRIRDLEMRRRGTFSPVFGPHGDRRLRHGGLDALFYWSELNRLERRLQTLEGPYP